MRGELAGGVFPAATGTRQKDFPLPLPVCRSIGFEIPSQEETSANGDYPLEIPRMLYFSECNIL